MQFLAPALQQYHQADSQSIKEQRENTLARSTFLFKTTAAMIQFAKVTKSYGGKTLYRDGSFQLNPGEKVGLVGPNGAGKTTVFRILVGETGGDSGSVGKSSIIIRSKGRPPSF